MDQQVIESLFRGISGISVWFILKIMVLFAMLLYLIFALVVVKQVGMMTDTLNDHLELPLKLLGAVHLALAIIVFLLALIIL